MYVLYYDLFYAIHRISYEAVEAKKYDLEKTKLESEQMRYAKKLELEEARDAKRFELEERKLSMEQTRIEADVNAKLTCQKMKLVQAGLEKGMTMEQLEGTLSLVLGSTK
ncbi:hypothetical protein BGZ94_004355 [Podila epigama]|nr:hypothetical protein BGZ94_004355 [Podila epigama]